jgi:glutamine synthetase
MIDLRLTDMSGLWQHYSVPPSDFDVEGIERGVGFHGSSINRFQQIQQSEMLALPDPASAFLDPFAEMPTLVLICNIRDPVTGQSHPRDPRHIAQKAEAYLQTTQIGDTANFGLELEHFVFDEVSDDQSTHYAYHENYTGEANWSTARRGEPDLGHVLRQEDNVCVPPANVLEDVRTQVLASLDKIGIKVDAQIPEFATSRHGETGMRLATLTRMADNVMMFKYVVNNVARQRGMTATSVMKSLFGDNGSGMRVQQSIWQGERPLFAGDGYAGSSALMRHYIAGLLEHAPALLEICAPVADPSRRVVPGRQPLVNLGCSTNNLSAACHIPTGAANPTIKSVRFRCPDPSCNPYLAFAAMLMAGIDGFHNRLYDFDPDEPIEPLYDLPPPELARTLSAQSSLDALESDHAFLLAGDVFTPDVIDAHLSYKRMR